MTDEALKLEIKLNYPVFFGVVLLAHLLLIAFTTPEFTQQVTAVSRTPIKIHTLGEKNSKSHNSVFLKPQAPSFPNKIHKPGSKTLDLRDLTAGPQAVRPGQMPAKRAAPLSGLRYGSEDFQKMARDPMLAAGADILTTRKVALNFEVPEGKSLDELNDSELKLYGFLKRGAMKYVASLSSEIKDFELKNPHLQFPMTDVKQVMTGRLTYDGQGNLKQIKMVRWTNVDKLQGFFENVMKRLDTLQNPPKELWVEDGEFTVFVTLQING